MRVMTGWWQWWSAHKGRIIHGITRSQYKECWWRCWWWKERLTDNIPRHDTGPTMNLGVIDCVWLQWLRPVGNIPDYVCSLVTGDHASGLMVISRLMGDTGPIKIPFLAPALSWSVSRVVSVIRIHYLGVSYITYVPLCLVFIPIRQHLPSAV